MRELLMALMQGQGLGRLDETASAVGVYFSIFIRNSSARPVRPGGTGRCIVLGIVASPLMAIKARPESVLRPAKPHVGDRSRAGKGSTHQIAPSLGGLAPVRPDRPRQGSGVRATHRRQRRSKASIAIRSKDCQQNSSLRLCSPPAVTLPADRALRDRKRTFGLRLHRAPAHFPKQRFLALMRNERLASRCPRGFDDTNRILPTVQAGDRESVQAIYVLVAGRVTPSRSVLCPVLRRSDPRGPPKVPARLRATASPMRLARSWSIINVRRLLKLAGFAGAPVDPLRFRGNVYVEALAGVAGVRTAGPGARGRARR